MREQDDGSLLFPTRGKPPPIPSADYTRDPGNPFILRPVFPLCVLRSEGWQDCKCAGGGKVKFYACSKNHKVSLKECKACIAENRYEQAPLK